MQGLRKLLDFQLEWQADHPFSDEKVVKGPGGSPKSDGPEETGETNVATGSQSEESEQPQPPTWKIDFSQSKLYPVNRSRTSTVSFRDEAAITDQNVGKQQSSESRMRASFWAHMNDASTTDLSDNYENSDAQEPEHPYRSPQMGVSSLPADASTGRDRATQRMITHFGTANAQANETKVIGERTPEYFKNSGRSGINTGPSQGIYTGGGGRAQHSK
jgi:hypothetical protein